MGKGLIFFSDKANRFKGEEGSSILCKSRREEEDDQLTRMGMICFWKALVTLEEQEETTRF